MIPYLSEWVKKLFSPSIDLHPCDLHRDEKSIIDPDLIQEIGGILEDIIAWLRGFDDTETDRLKQGRDDSGSLRRVERNTPRKTRHDRSPLHTVIDLTGVSIARMSRSSRMDTTAIRNIEIATLISRTLHELPSISIKDVIYSATESITAITHSISGSGHRSWLKE